MKIRILKADNVKDFAELCKQAVADGYMFVGQMNVSGLGKGQFMYTQQWAKGIEDALQEDNTGE